MKLIKSIIISIVITFSSISLASTSIHLLPHKEDMYAQGSGFFINTDGYIATAAHVVEGADKVQVYFHNKLRDADVVAVDVSRDLAIIHLRSLVKTTPFLPFPVFSPSQEQTPYIPIAKSPNSNETMFIVGFPAVSEFGLYPHITVGHISSMNLILIPNVFLMNGIACHGNSGGLVMNYQGTAVGMLVLGFGGNGLCSNTTGANYLDGLIDLAKKNGVTVYSPSNHDTTPIQVKLYQVIQSVIAQEKVVFIQVHIPN